MGSSCSSAIQSHNSRDVIPSHNSRNTTCLTPIPSHNLRDTFRATTQGTPTNPPFKSTARRLVDYNFSIKSPSCSSTNRLVGDTYRQALPAPRPPGAASSQTAWRVSRTARRTTPQNFISPQVPPGGTTLTARHMETRCPLF